MQDTEEPMKGPCTVEKYLAVLSSKIVQHDVAMSRRERRPNIYRAGHLLAAAHKVADAVRGTEGRSDSAALLRLQKALHTHFEPDFPPLRQVERQITRGVCSLVRR